MATRGELLQALIAKLVNKQPLWSENIPQFSLGLMNVLVPFLLQLAIREDDHTQPL
jgi:hypothetical protein